MQHCRKVFTVIKLFKSFFMFVGVFPFLVAGGLLAWFQPSLATAQRATWKTISYCLPSTVSIADHNVKLRILEVKQGEVATGTFYTITGNRCQYVRMQGMDIKSIHKVGNEKIVEFSEADIDTLVDIATIIPPASSENASHCLSVGIGDSKDYLATTAKAPSAALLIRTLERFLHAAQEHALALDE
jgi:hypothetical protein